MIEQTAMTNRFSRQSRWIITVNDRLARWTESSSPVMSWENFVTQLWNEVGLVLPLPKVLSNIEALVLWERIIQTHSPNILRLKETAKRALQTFEWSTDYHLSFSEGSTETLIYQAWESHFLKEKTAQQQSFCMPSERLKILSKIFADPQVFEDFSYSIPTEMHFRGFEIFSPAQEAFFELLRSYGKILEVEDLSTCPLVNPQIFGCMSIEDEFRQALALMSKRVSKDPTIRVAIVVHNLPQYYLFLKRIAATYLADLPYVISAGLPLNQTPWAKSAFSLLRSQTRYFPAAALSQHLEKFLNLLKDSDWLGDSCLSSIAYQMVQGIFKRTENLARDSGGLGEISVQEALDHFFQALEVPFQEEDDPQAQIFILGLLEAAPLSFDVLWFCGASNEAFPTKPDPNPFIPYDLQRAAKLPRSSAEREEQLARKLLHRIRVNSKEFWVTYPRFNEGIRQTLSQVFEGSGKTLQNLASKPLEVLKHYNPQALEFYEETQIASVSTEEIKTLKGGAGILANQAACPFKAFAKNRLKVEAFEAEDPYFSAKDRGMLIHSILEKFWAQVRSSQALHVLSEEDLKKILEVLCSSALAELYADRKTKSSAQAMLEKEIVIAMVSTWLAFEKTRSPFEVQLLEKEILTVLSGLPLKLRIDRVDLILPEKEAFLIDYKTGRARYEEWLGDRIESPQLPLYATLMPVEGLAFADLSGRAPSFSGVARTQKDLLSMEGVVTVDKLKNSSAKSFDELLSHWKMSLEKLSQSFMKGEVKVDPLDTACRYCKLEALCRVNLII